jgi:photosystem II stability/assembly factor-like uncharacterized protein
MPVAIIRIAAFVGVLLGSMLALPGMPSSQTVLEVVPIGPRQSSLDPTDPDGASGGRVNGLAIAPNSNAVMYAASEWGGLFKSTDTGLTWQHLAGHTPVATWDVEVDPANASRVFATSFYDGRVASRAGINLSSDAGATWTRPASAMPPMGFCAEAARRDQPSAFGIAIDPAAPANVYIGTNCGLAISRDSGATWSFVDPTPADPADDVWDVVTHHGGIIDLCGDDGHQRSTDGGATWTTATGTNLLPSGRCSITTSPDEPHVLFAVVGTSIFESDDGGASWPVQYANPSAQGRIPFVEVNQRGGAQFDLWFGDTSLHRATCTTPSPPAPGGSRRCQPSSSWAGRFTRDAGGHDDTGAILFDRQVATDACPLLFSSDGGVYRNTVTTNPACHAPQWEQPNQTPQALWNWDMTGVARSGLNAEEIYFGNQDNGTFGSTDAGAGTPTWNNEVCCDGFSMAAEVARVLSSVCCWSTGRPVRLFISNPGLTGATQINTYPPGNLRIFRQLDSAISFGPGDYAVITTAGVFVTLDLGANPIVWTQLGAGSTPPNPCGIQATHAGGVTSFFVKSGGCSGDRPGSLWRFDGASPGGTWKQVTRAGGGQFGIFAVAPNDPNRIIASDLTNPGNPTVVQTTDGGTTWQQLTQLDSLMTAGGAFRYWNTRGVRARTEDGTADFGFNGYPQPTLVAFDPSDSDTIVAAGADSGVFLSRNGGSTWQLLTDPLEPGVSGTPHIPRARYAHFERGPERLRVYLGTQGRGPWRVTLSTAPIVSSVDERPGEPSSTPVALGGGTSATGTTGTARQGPGPFPPPESPIEIALPNGYRVTVPNSVDDRRLRRVLDVLERR